MRALKVFGKDAAEFLHRVTAGPVRSVPVGSGAAGALLDGKSKVQAQFDLLRLGADQFYLVSSEFCYQRLAEGLERLHFSESLEIAPTEERFVPVASGEKQERPRIFPVEKETWPALVPGYRWERGEGEYSHTWNFDRIGALVPCARSDWTPETPALEAGLLPSIDRHKGCYPGQEVVELSINVGHPVRVLVAYEGAEAPGEKIPFEGGGEAVVTSSSEKGGVFRVLARVPWAKKDLSPPGWKRLKGYNLE